MLLKGCINVLYVIADSATLAEDEWEAPTETTTTAHGELIQVIVLQSMNLTTLGVREHIFRRE